MDREGWKGQKNCEDELSQAINSESPEKGCEYNLWSESSEKWLEEGRKEFTR